MTKNLQVTLSEFLENYEKSSTAKITKFKGYGSLRNASTFGEAIHMDLEGDLKSLFPTTNGEIIPHATWFLLPIDDYTSWKWV
ncbi:putative serine threonine protein kinase domain protein [Erysiphe necator]|uniref:Putative serine threonine protein kinase domain protein n=1 Tax=Uncinula necator TaxID=52586 RepID=A0A0B1PC19_UNCNE|nr:putative serine threonine protein kinase domain protein [Erysiphe necator]